MLTALALAGMVVGGIVGAGIMTATALVLLVRHRRRPALLCGALALLFALAGGGAVAWYAVNSASAIERDMTAAPGLNYDITRPDVPGNRWGFERHFGFAPDTRTTQVYYYDDGMGADALYQLSFHSDSAVIRKIINRLDLHTMDHDAGGLIPREFPWWPAGATRGCALWGADDPGARYWRLWYDERSGIAYYLEYSV